MNFRNQYWYFEKALSDKFCDELIKYAQSKKEQLVVTAGFDAKAVLTKKHV